jgi:hypothetical protein
MLYSTSPSPVRASLDVEETPTVNAGRYRNADARVRLASCNGLPIAFRGVVVMNEGSFATRRVQAVTAKGITALSTTKAQYLHDNATHPLN